MPVLPSSPFLAQLFAPRPAVPARAETPRAERQLRASDRKAWARFHRHFYAADYNYRRAGMERSIADDEGTREDRAVARADELAAFDRLVMAIDRQMMLAAPNQVALRWKLAHREFAGGSPAWDAAIARDQARLEEAN